MYNSNDDLVQQILSRQEKKQGLLDTLKQNITNPSGDNAYKAGMLLFGGKPQESDPTSKLANAMALANYKQGLQDPNDAIIKQNQALTGTPDFKLKEAQIRANIDVQQALDIDKAKKAQAQADYDAAVASQNSQQPQQNQPENPNQNKQQYGPSLPTSMPGKDNNIPAFIPVTAPSTKKWDASIGRFVEEPGKVSFENNPDYLNPEAKQKLEDAKRAQANSEQEIRDNAQQNLESISEAKKGAKFFGPMGDVPSRFAPSSLPLVGGLTMGDPKLKGEYGDRANWEANINQLLSQKVVDLLTKMKQASKTGATGFGQLSDKEGAILRQASTALNKQLPPDVALKYLNEMEKINQRILSGGNSQTPDGTEQLPPELQALAAKGIKVTKNG